MLSFYFFLLISFFFVILKNYVALSYILTDAVIYSDAVLLS